MSISIKAFENGFWKSPFFLIVAGTLVATGLAARFTYGQWDVSFDTEKRSLRAYVLLTIFK